MFFPSLQTIAMESVESLEKKTLQHDFAMDYGDARLEVDFQLGAYKEIREVFETFKQLWAKRTETHTHTEQSETQSGKGPCCRVTLLPGKVHTKTPQMNILGDTAQDLLGRYTDKWLSASPHVTHHIIVDGLEPGMNMCVPHATDFDGLMAKPKLI